MGHQSLLVFILVISPLVFGRHIVRPRNDIDDELDDDYDDFRPRHYKRAFPTHHYRQEDMVDIYEDDDDDDDNNEDVNDGDNDGVIDGDKDDDDLDDDLKEYINGKSGKEKDESKSEKSHLKKDMKEKREKSDPENEKHAVLKETLITDEDAVKVSPEINDKGPKKDAPKKKHIKAHEEDTSIKNSEVKDTPKKKSRKKDLPRKNGTQKDAPVKDRKQKAKGKVEDKAQSDPMKVLEKKVEMLEDAVYKQNEIINKLKSRRRDNFDDDEDEDGDDVNYYDNNNDLGLDDDDF